MTGKTLLLRANGTAELQGPDGATLWASDSDEDFLEQWAGTVFLNESDVPELLNYLEDTGELTAVEANTLTIEEESLADEETADGEDASDDERE